MMIGIIAFVCWRIATAPELPETIASTLSRANSAANSENRSGLSSAKAPLDLDALALDVAKIS